MRIIIFNDKDNFGYCLGRLNDSREIGKKRFWRIEKYHDFFYKKVLEFCNWKDSDNNLIRSFAYTGEYTPEVLYPFRKYCREKIQEVDELIKKEDALLVEISSQNIDANIKKRVNEHVSIIKGSFQAMKDDYILSIKKHSKYAEGQENFIKKFPIHSMARIDLKTTPLKHRQGRIIQKGVDVLLATDLVNLAHNNAYDVAIILGGDLDLMESIKLVRGSLGKVVVIVSYFNSENPALSLISNDLIREVDYFINVKNLIEDEVVSMSDLLVPKQK